MTWKDSYSDAVKLSCELALLVQTNYCLQALVLIQFAIRNGSRDEAMKLVDETIAEIKERQNEQIQS